MGQTLTNSQFIFSIEGNAFDFHNYIENLEGYNYLNNHIFPAGGTGTLMFRGPIVYAYNLGIVYEKWKRQQSNTICEYSIFEFSFIPEGSCFDFFKYAEHTAPNLIAHIWYDQKTDKLMYKGPINRIYDLGVLCEKWKQKNTEIISKIAKENKKSSKQAIVLVILPIEEQKAIDELIERHKYEVNSIVNEFGFKRYELSVSPNQILNIGIALGKVRADKNVSRETKIDEARLKKIGEILSFTCFETDKKLIDNFLSRIIKLYNSDII